MSDFRVLIYTIPSDFISDTFYYCLVLDGEMASNVDVVQAYMKQKHRMIWLRRQRENGQPDRQYRD